MKLTTDRLILREMSMNDYDALYQVLADSDIMQHYPYTFDEERVRGWISKNVERYQMFGFGLWAVCLKETGEMIGDCGLTMQMIGGVIKPEIGYHIRGDQQRKGYAREAAMAVRDWTFENTPIQIIYSYMKYTNAPSAATALSWGCHLVDEFKDDVNEITKVFAITREEWLDMQDDWQRLYHAAKSVMNARSISPFIEAGGVGAAIMTKAGNIYTGVCIDTASTLGMCGERNAIANMITNGESQIDKLVAITPEGNVGSPCGACREYMMQLDRNSADIQILLDLETRKTVTLGELIPDWWGTYRFEA